MRTLQKKMMIVFLLIILNSLQFLSGQNSKKYVLVIHGGAGTILKSNMTDEKEKAYLKALTEALESGYQKIKDGKSSLDAVEAAITVLENSPLFNAGKGAVFTNEGKNELDAAIMDGKSLSAGAVASVSNIKNPISAARAVMEKSEHVMMVGKGAEKFAKKVGLTIVDPSYFYTKERWDALQKVLKEKKMDEGAFMNNKYGSPVNIDSKFGTVGAVALDKNGNLAAGTSTGGMTNKRYGRVGDAPIIGAGTYANNNSVAISCTGWGEFFIRSVTGHDISALMEYKKLSVEEATKEVLKKIEKLGGDGGIIGLDPYGNMTQTYNTKGMYRGAITEDGEIQVAIYE